MLDICDEENYSRVFSELYVCIGIGYKSVMYSNFHFVLVNKSNKHLFFSLLFMFPFFFLLMFSIHLKQLIQNFIKSKSVLPKKLF